LKKEHRLIVLEKRLLRETYGLMGEELTGELRKLTYNGFIMCTFEHILLEEGGELGEACGVRR
jgi:hypothetical protein